MLGPGFLAHASVIQAAPIASRGALLADYLRIATAVFGATTAGYMTATMRDWLALPATRQ